MKKLILVASLFLVGVAHAVTTQPRNIGTVTTDGPLGLYPRTLAQMNLLTADTTNQMIVVTDAVQSRVCVSTSSVTRGAWVVASASGTFVAGTYPHCQ